MKCLPDYIRARCFFTCGFFPGDCTYVVSGVHDLTVKAEERLGVAKKVRKYSSRNLLRRQMLELNPIFRDFQSSAKCGSGKFFFCRICHRVVGIKAHGFSEFVRHFGSYRHWYKDVTYRVHMELPVYNRLKELMTFCDSDL